VQRIHKIKNVITATSGKSRCKAGFLLIYALGDAELTEPAIGREATSSASDADSSGRGRLGHAALSMQLMLAFNIHLNL
jgi:hypothetical protein